MASRAGGGAEEEGGGGGGRSPRLGERRGRPAAARPNSGGGARRSRSGRDAPPVYCMGHRTLRVGAELFQQNRRRLTHIARRCHTEAEAGGALVMPLGVALLQGGTSSMRYDTDVENIFRQESFFAYLFGALEPGLMGAVDLRTGMSLLFLPKQDEAYAAWTGTQRSRSHYRQRYGVDEVYYLDEMVRVFKEIQVPTLHVLNGVNGDSGGRARPATFEGISNFVVDEGLLYDALCECRVVKSEAEIELIAYTNKVCCAAHVAVMREMRPGMYEYESEARFLFECYRRGGMRSTAYTPIVASGRRAAQLHYGHAGAPNAGLMRDGEMVLLDLGCEYCCYGADITCTYPVNGRFTADQRGLYEAVLGAQRAVLAAIRPGVSMEAMHRLSERQLLVGLKSLLVGEVDDMLSVGIAAIFMPHGMGHLLGIDTHDVGGYIKDQTPARPRRAGACYLRTARTLQTGMVLTVEPAVYLIEPLLSKALRKQSMARFIDLKVLERMLPIGGVRLEDDVVVTRDGCFNLTNLPRDVEDVEAVMAGAQWPREVIRTGEGSAAADKGAEQELGESVEGIRRVRSLTDIVIVEEKEKEARVVEQAQQTAALAQNDADATSPAPPPSPPVQYSHPPAEASHPPPIRLHARAGELERPGSEEVEVAPTDSPTAQLAKRVRELTAQEGAAENGPAPEDEADGPFV